MSHDCDICRRARGMEGFDPDGLEPFSWDIFSDNLNQGRRRRGPSRTPAVPPKPYVFYAGIESTEKRETLDESLPMLGGDS